MSVAKVTLNNTVILDLTDATATAPDIIAPKTAYIADGSKAVGTGSGGTQEEIIPDLKDVVYVDYDGTIVEQYTASDFLALNAHPSNPSHSGLTAQGWNWTLSDAKTYVQSYGILVIGQNYTTSDGKTKVYISVPEVCVDSLIYIGVITTVKNGVIISWGDGNTTVTSANANAYGSYSHSYSTAGDYIITLEATSGTYQLGGSNANQEFIQNSGRAMENAVIAVEIDDDVTYLHRGCFEACTNLRTCSIPTSITNIADGTTGNIFNGTDIRCIVLPPDVSWSGGYLANYCYNCRFISLPKSLGNWDFADGTAHRLLMASIPPRSTESNARVFYQASSLQKVSMPGTYTNIPTGFLRESRTVRKFTIPASVTNIAAWALHPMQNIREYHFQSASPPTLASASNMFTVNANVKIYVPYSADHSVLNAYQTASNWSTFTSYIEEETV